MLRNAQGEVILSSYLADAVDTYDDSLIKWEDFTDKQGWRLATSADPLARPMAVMDAKQKELARHALGLPSKSKRSYRNHFVIGEDDPDWMEMVAMGWATMRKAATLPFGGSACFYLTEAGARLALNRREKLDPEDFPPAA